MPDNPKILKIMSHTFTGHQATAEEWARAVPPIGHQNQPSTPLIIRTQGKAAHELEVRTDENGDLYLYLNK